MKNIIKLCVVIVLAACTTQQKVAGLKTGYDAALCILNHPPATPEQITLDCGKGELTNGDVANILLAAKRSMSSAGAPSSSASVAPCK